MVSTFILGVIVCAPSQTLAEREIKLGALFDLTGPTSDVGWHYVDGVRDYVKHINDVQGGIGNGVKVKLIWTDYQYKIPLAISTYAKLVKRDKVVAILGWGTGDSEALKTKIVKDQIPYISASFSQHLVWPPKWNFLPIATYADQVRTVMKYMRDQWNKPRKPRMALIYNNTGYGRAPLKPAKAYAEEIGVDLVSTEAVGLQDLEATSQLLRIKEKQADFVFIQETYTATATVLKDAKKLGLNDVIFTGNFWGTGKKLAELAGQDAEGYLGIMPFAIWSDDNEGVRFAQMLNAKYHPEIEYREPQYIAGMVNAMIMLHALEIALKNAAGNPEKVEGRDVFSALESIKSFDTRGLTTPVSYSADERRGSKGCKIVTIKDGALLAVTDFLQVPPVPPGEKKGK
jgi:branched-chain amino acid transport system substrate-binding protein